MPLALCKTRLNGSLDWLRASAQFAGRKNM